MIFDWNDQRQAIFLDRYALRHNGELMETYPYEMWERIATAVAHDKIEEDDFGELLWNFKFLPAGRILSAAGSKQHSATWYNCFVLGINPSDKSHGKDSRDSILNTISRMVEINCRGGGIGINWSVLRPDKSIVRGIHGTSTGSIGWMRGADALADQVRQGGSRTAALMFMLNDWHPDIEAFVRAERFKRANFSVAISNAFMDSLRFHTVWILRFPDTSDPAYDLLWNGDIDKWEGEGRRTIHREIDTEALWSGICEAAISCGSPGLVFIEKCNQLSNTRGFEKLIGTNPCGEQPLPEYGSCNLGSINLVSMCAENGDIDKKKLARVIQLAVKFLDNVIDKSPPIYPEIDGLQKLFRRIGLGTMGLADVLLLNKIRYGSQESLNFISELYSFIRNTAYLASSELARERGTAPMFSNRILNSPTVRRTSAVTRAACEVNGLRNMSILTQAPTGTVSILAGVSSGIEPVFASEYVRKDATGEYTVRHPLFQGSREAHHVTAYGVTPEEHIAVQAELQEYIDSSISKTVNLPACATAKDADKIFRLAYERGCKGVTIFRGGSENDVLSCKVCST